jgi:hypothetical protein
MLYAKQSRTASDCMSGDEVLYVKNGWMQEKTAGNLNCLSDTKTAKPQKGRGETGCQTSEVAGGCMSDVERTKPGISDA